MQENLPTKPTNSTLKSKIITFFVALIILAGSSVFILEKLFSDFEPTDPVNTAIDTDKDVSYKGVIKYIPPGYYFDENISYELVDENKNSIILLKSKDDKLKVAENLTVTVKGTRTKTTEGEPILIVTEVIVSN